MLIYQEFIAINEEMPAFSPNERLRYAVHEIMVKFKDGQCIKYEDLSERLKKEYKIDISHGILKIIFKEWDKFHNPDYSIFKKDDKNWMDVYDYLGQLRRKCRDKQNFGKHRKKEWPVTTHYPDYTPGYLNQTPVGGYWVGTKYYPYNNSTNPRPKDDSRFEQPNEYWGD